MSVIATEETEPFGLAEPQVAMIDDYVAALRAGWSPDQTIEEASQQLAEIERSALDFIARRTDKANNDISGQTFKLPDGTEVQRLPSLDRWIWDGVFVGRINSAVSAGYRSLAVVYPWTHWLRDRTMEAEPRLCETSTRLDVARSKAGRIISG